ncbi:MAG TPA: AAA family ATPase, partial [Sphingomonas sp.]|nr:AAA family ATPase [Sphingomonas sp.]
PGFVEQLGQVLPARRREAAISLLHRNLDARRIGTSYALRISYSDPDPDRAARIANGYASAYTQNQVQTKVQTNQTAIGVLRSRMEELRTQAQSDFRALQNYRISNGLETKSGTALTEQEVSAYSQQVATARSDAARDQARLAQAREQLRRGEISDGGALSALRAQRAQLSVKLAELSQRYLDTHPEVVAARSQVEDIDRQIQAEAARSVASVEAAATASQQRLASLEASLGGASRRLATNNSALVVMDDLERRAQASQELYESYLNRYKEAVARSGAEQPNADVLSAAVPPPAPSSPILLLNLVLGVLVGILLGVAAAIAAEQSYSGLTTGEEVERRLGVPAIGSLPLLKSLGIKSGTPLETVQREPGGAFAESIRSVLAAVRQANSGRGQVVMITSALPKEGKTTLSACLAQAAATANDRVVLIDCDTVRSSLSAALVVDKSGPGLKEILDESAPVEAALQPFGDTGALLPIRTRFKTGERLLEQGRLQRLVASLRERFDLIVLDCAPLLPIAETREIASLADAILVTVRWRNTGDGAIRAALKMVPPQKIARLGVVLNMVDMRKRARFGEGDPAAYFRRYRHYYTS